MLICWLRLHWSCAWLYWYSVTVDLLVTLLILCDCTDILWLDLLVTLLILCRTVLIFCDCWSFGDFTDPVYDCSDILWLLMFWWLYWFCVRLYWYSVTVDLLVILLILYVTVLIFCDCWSFGDITDFLWLWWRFVILLISCDFADWSPYHPQLDSSTINNVVQDKPKLPTSG